MNAHERPILFCCTHSAGEANTSLAVAGELARRGVEDLWFATDENHRARVAALAARSTVNFASLGEVNPRLALTMLDDETYRSIMHHSHIRAIRARTATLMDADHHFERYQRLDAVVDEIKPALMVINRFCTFATQIAITRGIPYALPVPDHLRLLGAMTPAPCREPKDEDTLGRLDSRESVVYVAFGSVTRLTREEIGSMLEVVRRLGDEHHVLWMLPEDQHHLLPEPGDLPGNLRIASWIDSRLLWVAAHDSLAELHRFGQNATARAKILGWGRPAERCWSLSR